MKIPIIYSDEYLLHAPPLHHAENPERLRVALSNLKNNPILSPENVGEEEPKIIHEQDYVNLVKLSSKRAEWLDADTYTNEYTWKSALLALGGSLTAYKNQGFALVRPPGHHAGKAGRAFGAPTLGFCIFNNISYPILKFNLKRVAIIDFDVHYGNGTQDIFWDNPEVVHIDVHQDPHTLYPGTGFPDMIGEGEAKGTKINLLLPPLSGDDLYEELFPLIQSILDDYKPSVIAFSAGFDGFEGDGLASLRATERTYYNFGLLGLKRRFYAILEGGYSIGLERGLKAFVGGLEGEKKEYIGTKSSEKTRSRFQDFLSAERRILRDYWKV
ncbi:histone deacetylase family protein [Stygiolobus caldivivus]|uniref:Acetylpolyamine amidohydrolase n=1 Tax=Stygiolobus caldivivus TaxID=2824673 RepID=A0A8D5U5G7_9CREN|nr:histone deacetylase family protein [Stygiolobus caldivivus]BCU69410.1 acetylpolyamine amidohydrolase [Stygiolobus caldivivus]